MPIDTAMRLDLAVRGVLGRRQRWGAVKRHRFCPVALDETFDAYYCPLHNRWIEKKHDGDCPRCATRPRRPLTRRRL